MFEVEVQSSWSNVESVIERKVQEENEQNILIKKEKVENLWSELIKQSKAKGSEVLFEKVWFIYTYMYFIIYLYIIYFMLYFFICVLLISNIFILVEIQLYYVILNYT